MHIRLSSRTLANAIRIGVPKRVIVKAIEDNVALQTVSSELRWDDKMNSKNMKVFRNAVSPIEAVKLHRDKIIKDVLLKTRNILIKALRIVREPLLEEDELQIIDESPSVTEKDIQHIRESIESVEWTSNWIEDELTSLHLRDTMRLCVVLIAQALEDVLQNHVIRDSESVQRYIRDSVASARLALFQSKRVEDILVDALEIFSKQHESSTKQRRIIADMFLNSTKDLFENLRLSWPCKEQAETSSSSSACTTSSTIPSKQREEEEQKCVRLDNEKSRSRTSQKRGTYFGMYTPQNVAMQQSLSGKAEEVKISSSLTSSIAKPLSSSSSTYSNLIDFSIFAARECEEMKRLENQMDIIERHFLDGRMQISDVAAKDFSKSLKDYCEKQQDVVRDLIQACIKVAPVISRRVRKDKEVRMNLLKTRVETIGAKLLSTHDSLLNLPVQESPKEPLQDLERLLRETDKIVHTLSKPFDLSAHHKFEHSCSFMTQKIERHCENVKRRCEKFEIYQNKVLERFQRSSKLASELSRIVMREWKVLKQSYAPLLPPLRVRKEFEALKRFLKTSLDCTSEDTLKEGIRMREAKFRAFLKVMKRSKKSATFLVRHLRSRMIRKSERK